MKKVHKEIISMLLLLCMVLLCILLFFYYKKQTRENMEGEMTNEKIKYYVITLGSDDRKQNIGLQQQKMKSKIEIVNGVVGKNLTKSEIQSMVDPVIQFTNENIDDPTQANNIKKNEIGCYISHYQLYKKIAEDTQHSYSVILEDDFVISDDFEDQLHQSLTEMVSHPFDLIYLYLSNQNESENKTDNVCVITEDMCLYGITGYIINHKNIQKIIDETRVMKEQIDVQLQNSVRSKKLEAYKSCPYILHIAGLPSTIQTL